MQKRINIGGQERIKEKFKKSKRLGMLGKGNI